MVEINFGPLQQLFGQKNVAVGDAVTLKEEDVPDHAVYKYKDDDGKDAQFINKDAYAKRKEYVFELPQFLREYITPHMNDMRDMVIATLFFNIATTTVPIWFMCWYFSPPSWVCFCVWSANYAVYFSRWVLGFHYAEHRPIFKYNSPLAPLNSVWGFVMCFFFGFVPGGYKLHHCIMHHIENNQGDDLSATCYYQRNNFKHFLWYWIRHLFFSWIELVYYAYTHGRMWLYKQCFLAGVLYYGSWFVLYPYNPRMTRWMIIYPHVLTSFFLMFGNWCQHLFVNPKNPFQNSALAFNVVNFADNQISFNDGYHVVHHENGRLHWSEMPTKWMSNIPRYIKEGCINFENAGIFNIGVWVFSGNYKALCDAYLRLPGEPKRTEAELTAMFKERLRAVPRSKVSYVAKDGKTARSTPRVSSPFILWPSWWPVDLSAPRIETKLD